MLEFIRKMTLATAGLAMMTTEKIEEFVDELVKKGEMTEKEARDTVSEYLEKSEQIRKDFENKTEELVISFLKRMNIPTRNEIDELKARIEHLEKMAGAKE